MEKIVKMSFEGKSCRKWANRLKMYASEKKGPQGLVCPHPGTINKYPKGIDCSPESQQVQSLDKVVGGFTIYGYGGLLGPMTLKPYLISRTALVYPLVCHFGSLGKIIIQSQDPIMTPEVGTYLTPGCDWQDLCIAPHDIVAKLSNIQALCHVVAEKKIFFMYFHYKSMVDNDMPGEWPY